MLGKFKAILQNDAFFNSLLLLLVSIASFGLGKQSANSLPLEIPISDSVEYPKPTNKPVVNDLSASVADSVTYVASKNSDKYHLLWCSGAKTISEANKVYFTSKSEAEAAGYKPAGNCKGI